MYLPFKFLVSQQYSHFPGTSKLLDAGEYEFTALHKIMVCKLLFVLASIVEACFAAVIDCYVFAVGSVEFSHHAYQKVQDIQNPKLSTIKATINYAKSHPCTIKMSVSRSIDGERFGVSSIIAELTIKPGMTNKTTFVPTTGKNKQTKVTFVFPPP